MEAAAAAAARGPGQHGAGHRIRILGRLGFKLLLGAASSMRLAALAGWAIVFAASSNPCHAFVAAPRLRALPRTLARGVSARQRVEAKAALAEAKDFLGWVLVPPPPPLDSTTVRTARHVGPNRAAIESG